MAGTKNKYKFGLRNAYYSVISETEGTINYAVPVAMPGAVNLNLSIQGESNEFYADDIPYCTISNNRGYQGSIEFVMLPDDFREKVMGYTKDLKGVVIENKDIQPKHFALLFEIQGNEKPTRYVFYNVIPDRANFDASTKGETAEPKTDVLPIKAIAAVDTGNVLAKTTADGDGPTYENWFGTVYVDAK